MPRSAGKRFRYIIVVYWLLLLYIVAALVWWFVSLERQNQNLTDLRLSELNSQKATLDPKKFAEGNFKIEKDSKRNTEKYIAEGVTFLILIFVGAFFVYRSTSKQFRVQLQQQNFMMAITHELKTPISVAMLNLETLQKYQLDAEKQKKLIRMTLQETSRLDTLINNILVSSQLEGGGYTFSKEELDFSSLFKDCIREAKTRYPERNFIENIEPEIEIAGDPLLLQLLISNLIENAVKYSPKEKPIICKLNRSGTDVLMNIIDEGIGIADTEKSKIFDKFYRTGNESTRKTKGTGLGLYLCNKIAGDHNADISVTNNIPSGTNFAIHFHT
ncbi:MAG: HAMP domain-containing histidine kinase [Bacteroidetes bacterium]|jgi:two-component system sensor histidine kinase CiaH|nr:MAG: HAMP domain-containing histidine kinase [Bacteroidota bacterium]